MATCKLVFTRALSGNPWGDQPLVIGGQARAQVLTLPATSVAAIADETLVRVRADADGYLAIGPTVAHGELDAPTVTPQAVHPIFADEWAEFTIAVGDRVAMIAAA